MNVTKQIHTYRGQASGCPLGRENREGQERGRILVDRYH